MKYTALALAPSSHAPADSAGRPPTPSSTGWHDLPWAVLFCAHLVVVCGLSGWLLASGRVSLVPAGEPSPDSASTSSTAASLLASPVALLIACALVLSIVLSLAYLSLLRLAPSQVIRATLYAAAALLLLSTLSALLAGSVGGALLSGLLFVLQLLWAWSVQRRIAFSALLLELSVQCLYEFPSVAALPLCGLLTQAGWLATWLTCAATLYSAMDARQSSLRSPYADGSGGADGGVQALCAALLLSYYWTAMVIFYVVHTAVAGVAGVYYFLHPNRTPPNPVLSSVRRSLTTSFGSICLGSLVVAAVRTVRAVLNAAVRRQGEDRQRSVLLDAALYCAQCLLSLIEGIIQYISSYAFVRCAVHGESFCDAAYHSVELLRSRGLDAVINDSLIAPVTQLGSLLCGAVVSAAVGATACAVLPSAALASVGGAPVVFVVAFLLGAAVAGCALEPVNAAVSTMFVLLAEDPHAMAEGKPEQYRRLSFAMAGRYDVDMAARQQDDVERQYGSVDRK